ncbi:transcriptional regulator [Amycolatopsis alkalitolerans]|uniref:transcriptional regulator n=1 Tax=Amycolatopsis alkalitolerans TaxID=2547244 RepID=UPI00190F3C7B|nr:transcriptional regulator [Amycolatopsis alkalitolerans]
MSFSARRQLAASARPFRTVLEQKIRERRLTLEEFSEYAERFARENAEPGTLSVRHLNRLVAGHGPKGEPLGQLRPATARLLERIFAVPVDELLASPRGAMVAPELLAAFGWLDGHVGTQVTRRVAELERAELLTRQARRAPVGRAEVADALADYYGRVALGYECDGRPLTTSVLARPEWLDLACSLTPDSERLGLAYAAEAALGNLVEPRAVDRLAEAVALGVRITDAPVYRLLDIDVQPGAISGTVGLASFVDYALTADLLEGELIDALAAGERTALELRDRYLPDVTNVLNVADRLCAGGPLALCAIARAADAYRAADYVLLVQERSAHVLNAPRRLSVIPKAFHQPLTDVAADTPIRATLLRELEEELFGRHDVDSTAGERRAAVPMHPERLSEPMAWLLEDPERLRIECTGFGLNLVSGNYEFASLVVIEDEEFWTRFGGHVEANWEASGLRLYSSLDRQLLAELAADEAWANEGLFALLQGFRRLDEIGGRRVNVPTTRLLTASEP